ncbi:LGFP repeat-containing protein [Modestobacter sp. VKM Ac-2984]|uniref:LGFP repeat-containing protein n=1 Tax=Modestobacter sp. VKM Ac-2984 TaxID=3004138 RepID=UPI0022AA204B|nr:hypothetical protein [Modestobacter sp. VKM Ac-2984]MCZ2817088.1 hypothetical protein [Modestobacter sp. VKM Ac-2984]
MIRTVARLLTITALVATALALPGTGTTPAGTAQAADLSYFEAGNIISDAVFFDGLATDVGTVQTFLDAKGANCVAGEMPCLKDYRQTTADQSGDAYCSTYLGAANESAASILVKIGAACRINPRVLVVLLQKEQGLVTGTKPSAMRYTKATGFACPDTSPCNPEFSGFVSQVYFAARQFQRYAAGVAGSYRAGKENKIHYHPNLTGCGSSQVYIQNKATAGLYSYTPYQPNAAALAAGYRTGDGCSSYGNRNFWNYFTDWFGSTQSTGGGAIYGKYQALGGETGGLGAPVTSFLCGLAGGGCWQTFSNGRIYWSPWTGAQAVTGDFLSKWAGLNAELGSLGYPLTDSLCGLAASGCYQVFQRGSVYSSPSSGIRVIRGDIRAAWQQVGAESGVLSYPVTEEICGLRLSGCWQAFLGGRVYWTASIGARVLRGDMLTSWLALGSEAGVLGYPTTNAQCGLIRGGCYQLFLNGALYSSPTSGTQFIRGSIRTTWQASGSEYGALGYPTSSEACAQPGGACAQTFESGQITWSASTGAHVLTPAMSTAWAEIGAGGGALGHPLMDTQCGLTRSGCYQVFQNGALYSTPTTGTRFVRGAIRTAWQAAGLEYGALGYPTSNETCGLTGGTCVQTFEGGHVYWSARTGAHPVHEPVLSGWLRMLEADPSIGFPIGSQRYTTTGLEQLFTGGTVVYSAANGSVFVAR